MQTCANIGDAKEPCGAVVVLGHQQHRVSLQSEASSDVEKPVLSGVASRGSFARNTMHRALAVRAFVLSGQRGNPMSRWITVEPVQLPMDKSPYPENFPPSPGCYVVYCDGKPVYIGQTTNLENRLYSYNFRYGYGGGILTPWNACQKLLVKYRPSKKYGDWAMIELRLIKRLQPIFNCVGSVKKRKGTE
jgi:hypothetical protein